MKRKETNNKTSKKATMYIKRKQKRPCFICANKIDYIDFKDIDLLKRFISDRGKIAPRKQSFLCAKHQRDLNTAIKRARDIGLLPFQV